LCFGTQALKVPRVKPLFLSGKKKGFKEKRSWKRKKKEVIKTKITCNH